MTRKIQAIFANGVLKPVQPLEWIKENCEVQVTVTSLEAGHPLAGWQGGLSDQAAAEMMRAIDQEFENNTNAIIATDENQMDTDKTELQISKRI